MAKTRLNKVIDLLERGQTVFSCGTVPNGNYDDILALSRSAYDLIILETEHVGFDFPTLRHSLQYLLNWGLTPQEYCDAADVWPLDPDGELLLMGIVENVRGIAHLPDILRQVKGIGAIWAGPGDLSVSMGLRGNSNHPDVEAALLTILAICKEYSVPCATGLSPTSDVATRLEQGFRIIMVPPSRSMETLTRGRNAAGRTD